MKIVKPSVEFWGQCPTDYQGNLALIERAGRLCYKSEDKIGPGTAEKFVGKLTVAVHWAMLEHSNLVLRESDNRYDHDDLYGQAEDTYLTRYADRRNTYYIGGNLRAWLEVLGIENLTKLYNLDYRDWEVCPHNEIPAALHRYTVKFICDRGVSHELVRHRPCSFAQESTRYVNYGGKDMEFVEPWWWDGEKAGTGTFTRLCQKAERDYKDLLKLGHSPQAARAVLPNALKTEIVVTADAAEWGIIKKLRLHKAAHPDMQRIMAMVPWEKMWRD